MDPIEGPLFVGMPMLLKLSSLSPRKEVHSKAGWADAQVIVRVFVRSPMLRDIM